MLLRLAQHPESTSVITAFTHHQSKQLIKDLVIPPFLGHQPQLVAHQHAVFTQQNILIAVERVIQGINVDKR